MTKAIMNRKIVVSTLGMVLLVFSVQCMSYGQTLSASSAQLLTETTLDGSVVMLTLQGGTFSDHRKYIVPYVSVDGISEVTTGDADLLSDTEIQVRLKFSGRDFDRDGTLTFKVHPEIIKHHFATVTAEIPIPVTATTESLTASAPAPLTEATLPNSTVTLTLRGRTFEDNVERSVSVSGVSGVSIGDVELRKDTEIQVRLKFNGALYRDDILTFTVDSRGIKNYIGSALTDETPVTATTESLTATSTPTPLTEATLHNSTVTLTLRGRTFEDNVGLNLSVSGISGVSVSNVGLLSDTEVTVRLEFNRDFNRDTTLTFTVDSRGIKNYTGSALSAQIPVTTATESLTATSTPTPLTEATLDNSRVTLTLRGRTFEDNVGLNLSVSGISGVRIGNIRLLSNTEVEVLLNFNGDFDRDDALTFGVSNGGIKNYTGSALTATLPVSATVEAQTPVAPTPQPNVVSTPQPVTPTPQPTGTPVVPTPTPTPTVANPSRITISGSATRSGATVNQQLDAPLLVRVLDDGGNGVADVRVTFRVISGRGKVSEHGNGQAIGVRTDRSGYASADLTPLEEGTLTVQASATGVTQTVEFTITTSVAPTSIVPVTTRDVVTTHPHPSIYWPDWDTGKIHYVDLDSSNVHTLVTGAGYPSSIALDIAGEKIYWTNSGVRFVKEVETPNGKIQCADLDGSNITNLVTGLESPYRMALDIARGKMYWTGENKIQRANLDGSNVQDIVTGVGEPISIALDVAGGKIYWTDWDKIQCADLDGSNITNLVATNLPGGMANVGGIALDVAGGKMYWTDIGKNHNGMIRCADLDGSNITNLAFTGEDRPLAIALDVAEGKMYWGSYTGRAGEIRCADLDGSNLRDIVTGVGVLWDIDLGILPQTIEVPLTKTTQIRVDVTDSPPMYWIDTVAGTLHRLVNAEVENLVPSVQNATSLTVDMTNEKLYWTEKTGGRTGRIRSATLDGTNVQLVKDLTSVPLDIVLDAADGKLYLTNAWGKVQRLNVDGSGFQPNFITGLDTLTSLIVDTAGQKLYWTEKTSHTTGRVRRANLNGTNVGLVRDLTSVPLDIALDVADRKLYWTNSRGKVQRLNVDGSGFQPNFITGLDTRMNIAVDTAGQKLYLTSPDGKISRQDLNGGGSEEVVTGLGSPGALVLGGETPLTETTTGIVTAHSFVSMYWTDSSTGKIQRANLDGSNVTDLVTDRHLLTNGSGNLSDIAVDVAGGKIYWTYSIQTNIESEELSFMGKIQCSDLDGSNVTDLVTEESHVPEGITLDIAGGKMYWTDTWNWKIRRADLDGSNVTDLVTELAASARDIAVDVAGGKMYWTSVEWTDAGSGTTAKIWCADLDGSNVTDLVTKQGHINGIALDVADGKMYTSWGEQDDSTETWNSKIQCSDLDGSNVTDLVTETGYPPEGIALDVSSGKMYWTSWGEWGEATIRSANLDGSNVTDLVTIGFGTPDGIALGTRLQNTGESPAKATGTPPTTDRAEDVNQDGTVDNVDLGMVAAALFGGNPPATLGRLDVNGDGVLTIDDLTQVSNNLDEDAAAAPALGIQFNALARDKIQAAIDRLLATDDGSIGVQRTLAYLQTLLTAARPDETRLLANYPNPFNPETWLPYALATDSNVRISIYDASGKVIRRLVLGYQSAGYYTSRSRAAYWDGRNAQGERVASGLYFYNLTTGDFTATRRMLILK